MDKIIHEGPRHVWENSPESIGKICYNSLKSFDEDHVILIDNNTEEKLTSKNLIEVSVTLAKYFKKIGLTRNDVISVVSENTWKYVTVILAGLYTGIPINTVNPKFNEDELKHCFSIIEPKLIFCSTNALNTLLGYNKNNKSNMTEIILFDDAENEKVTNFNNVINGVYNEDPFEPENLDARESVALILFSSGTSGLPKAVQLTHNNVRHAYAFVRNPTFFVIDESSVLIGLLPMFHIFGLLVGLCGALYGCKCVILTEFKPDKFLKAIQDHKVTHLYVVPTLLIFLAKSPMIQDFDVSSVKAITCGAAPTGKEFEILVQKRFKDVFVAQLYGLTEASGATCITPLNSNCKKYGSAGIPVDGATVKIVDTETKQDLPCGQVGEIYIKGTGVMKGYYKNLKETKDTFNQDGFLKSGDMGYFDEDGYIFIIDRLKEVIKYKGFQIPPAELEHLLLKHEGIVEAAVIGKPDEIAGELPVAFVVKHKNSTITENSIVEYVAKNVSVEKRLRGGVVFVEEIPKNSSGKILRRILREQYKKM